MRVRVHVFESARIYVCMQASNDLGRVVNRRHFDRLMGLLSTHRGEVVTGGVADADDLFISPTIIRGPDTNSPIMKAWTCHMYTHKHTHIYISTHGCAHDTRAPICIRHMRLHNRTRSHTP